MIFGFKLVITKGTRLNLTKFFTLVSTSKKGTSMLLLIVLRYFDFLDIGAKVLGLLSLRICLLF